MLTQPWKGRLTGDSLRAMRIGPGLRATGAVLLSGAVLLGSAVLLGGAVLLGSAVVMGCVQKGDTEVDVGEKKQKAKTLCAELCEKQEDECGRIPNCEAKCVEDGELCPRENQDFLECAVGKPVGCDGVNGAYTSGCSAPRSALDECLASAGVVGWGGNCTDEGTTCAEGSVCVDTSETQFGDYVCLPYCEDERGCPYGCCLELDNGGSVCGFPADCAPVGTGDPCINDSDCASDWCAEGSCIAECETDEDCGSNFLGEPNGCWMDNDPPVCLPGCADTTECTSYYAEHLACVEHPGGTFCF